MKSIVINGKTFPTSEELVYHFEYDEKGVIQKILAPQNTSLEWITNEDSLKVRYLYFDDEGTPVFVEMYIEHEHRSVKNILVTRVDNYESNHEQYRVFSNGLTLDSISSNSYTYYTFLPGFKTRGVMLSDYRFFSDGYEVKADYGYELLGMPVRVEHFVTDTIRVFYQKKSSSIPLPSQSYGRITPWTFMGNDFISLSIYFLQLSGYHIHEPYLQLPSQFLLNGNEWMNIDYQWDMQNQVTTMKYQFTSEELNSNWNFSYY